MLSYEHHGALGRAVQMCAEFRAGRQGLKTSWPESVQMTARWLSRKPKFPRFCLFAVLLGLSHVKLSP